MKNGFYCDLEEIKKDCEEATFEFMETQICGDYDDDGYSPFDFLHGCCDVFSYMLNNKYGYSIEQIYNKDNLVHSYCIAICGGEKVYIDVRGITNNWETFIAEFEDYNADCVIKNISCNDVDTNSVLYRVANSIDECYRYYKLPRGC